MIIDLQAKKHMRETLLPLLKKNEQLYRAIYSYDELFLQGKMPSRKEFNGYVESLLLGRVREHYCNVSRLWYLMPEQAQAYLAMHDLPQYSDGMLRAEERLLRKNVGDIVREGFAEDTCYIDLGPGMADKSLAILREAERQGKRAKAYAAIDISDVMLSNATKTMELAGVAEAVAGYKGDFMEHFWEVRDQYAGKQAFIYLGSTISNFPVNLVNDRIFEQMKSSDCIYLSVQPKRAPEELVRQYDQEFYMRAVKPLLEAVDIVVGPMRVRFNEETSTVENYFEVEEVPIELSPAVIKGDKIIAFTSWKPTVGEFQRALFPYIEGCFYEGEGFIGCTGKRR